MQTVKHVNREHPLSIALYLLGDADFNLFNEIHRETSKRRRAKLFSARDKVLHAMNHVAEQHKAEPACWIGGN